MREQPANGSSSGKLERIFNRRNPDGSFYYSDDDVKNVLPVVLLRSPVAANLDELEKPTLRMISEFLSRLGVDLRNPDPDDFDTRLEQHWAEHPPNPELMDELRDLALEIQLASNTTAEAFHRFADVARRFACNEPPPEGSIRSTAGIQFFLGDWKKKGEG